MMVISNEFPAYRFPYTRIAHWLITEDCTSFLYNQFSSASTQDITYCSPGLLLSKFMGLFVSILGCIIKLPLILSLVPASPDTTSPQDLAQQIPLGAYYLELLGLILGLAFNQRLYVNISAYGELVPLILQDLIIIGLTLYHRHRIPRFILISMMSLFVYVALMNETWVPLDRLYLLVVFNVPLVVATMVPLVVLNAKRGHTMGFPLNMVSVGTAMGWIRVFTTYMEVPGVDWTVMAASLVGPVLNAIVLGQVVMMKEATMRAAGVLHPKQK